MFALPFPSAAMKFILLHRAYKRNEFCPKIYSFKILTEMTFKCHRNTKSKIIWSTDWTFVKLRCYSIPLSLSCEQIEKEPMHPIVYVAISSTKCWRRHSYAFAQSSHGHAAVAGQRVPLHSFRNDKSTCASFAIIDDWLFNLGFYYFIYRAFTITPWAATCATTRSWSCQSSRTHRSRRIWKIEWMRRCKSIRAQRLFWCDVTASMFGERLGKRQKLSKCNRLIQFKWFSIFFQSHSLLLTQNRTECYDYLFAIAIEMRKCGFEPNEAPVRTDRK